MTGHEWGEAKAAVILEPDPDMDCLRSAANLVSEDVA